MELGIIIAEGRHGATRVQLSGELDLSTVPAVECVLADLRAEGCAVEVDLRDVLFADLPGMRPLWAACLKPGEGRVRIVAASPAVRRLVGAVLHVMADRRQAPAPPCGTAAPASV